jgi:hypothetical protein
MKHHFGDIRRQKSTVNMRKNPDNVSSRYEGKMR